MIYKGWGRKASGQRAVSKANKARDCFLLQEDGFIRSTGLGDSQSFSIVEDDVGIYYDAKTPSKLEDLLNNYNFKFDSCLLKKTAHAIDLIRRYQISKYNHATNIDDGYFSNTTSNKVLIIAQTKGDLSLEYGLAERFNTNEIINTATRENPNAEIYLKVHPDVLNGRKGSDIDIESVKTKCKIISDDVNPISLLKHFSKVYTKTSQMGFEALIVGCECVCFGMPFYAGWGLTDDRVGCERRKRKLSVEEVFAASYILYTKYFNPYIQKPSDIIDTIKTIVRYRDIERMSNKKIFLFGFSRWKHGFVAPFLKQFNKKNINFINPIFSSNINLAIRKGMDKNCEVYIWGAGKHPEIEKFAQDNNIKITRVEDGFIRSIGLGSDLTRPYSLAFDDVGIYFEPTQPSKLEEILDSTQFDSHIINEATQLIRAIVDSGISKYNNSIDASINIPSGKKSILVVGQVEDDASIKLGANSMTNLSLLKQVRAENSDAVIVYKPHPDVVSGNRVGKVSGADIDLYSDLCLVDIGISELISKVDEVHTMTSTVGFEALLQGKVVVTYGMPFYAGWGLTKDKLNCERRTRKLSLPELVAGALILYPRYIDPNSGHYCAAELLIDRLKEQKDRMGSSFLYRTQHNLHSFISRRLQKILSWF